MARTGRSLLLELPVRGLRLRVHQLVVTVVDLVVPLTEPQAPTTVTPAEIIYHPRVRLLALADELGNVAEAWRLMGESRTRFYEWPKIVAGYGIDALMPKGRRRPQLPNATPTHSPDQDEARSAADRGTPRLLNPCAGHVALSPLRASPAGTHERAVRRPHQTLHQGDLCAFGPTARGLAQRAPAQHLRPARLETRYLEAAAFGEAGRLSGVQPAFGRAGASRAHKAATSRTRRPGPRSRAAPSR
jgi:hypothetical protein